MRSHWLPFVLLACSAPPDGHEPVASPPNRPALRAEASSAARADASAEASGDELRSELCFNPTAEFDSIEPAPAGEMAVIAAARWGWPARIDTAPECTVLDVGELEDVEGRHQGANWTPENVGTKREPKWLSGAYAQGRDRITINREYIENRRILNTSAQGCRATHGVCYPLAAVLTHEIGHMLVGLAHSHDPESPLRDRLISSDDPWPTEADLEAALQPAP